MLLFSFFFLRLDTRIHIYVAIITTEMRERRKPNEEKPIAICVSGGSVSSRQSGSGGTHTDTDTLTDIEAVFSSAESVRIEEGLGRRVIMAVWVAIILSLDSWEDDTVVDMVFG